MRVWRAIALVCCAAMTSCGGCENDPPNPCAPCTDDLFSAPDDASVEDALGDANDGAIDDAMLGEATDLVCYEGCAPGETDPGCESERRGCVKLCDADHPCTEEGHPCIAHGGHKLCSFYCVSEACGTRRECRGMSCTNVDCGFITPCLDATNICDPVGHRCFPFDGRCTTVDDCPTYDGYWSANGALTCTAGYCRIGLRPLLPPPGLTAPPIGVVSPESGQTYADETQIAINWSSDYGGARSSTIVLVLDGYPEIKSDLRDRAVWGAALTGVTGPVSIASGRSVEQGTWGAQPGHIPANRLLTLVIQIVEDGELIAVSSVVPFSVGAAWRNRGDPCNPDVPLACASPVDVLACHPVTFTCERVCGSYRDCLDSVPVKDCGAPRGFNRFCE